MNREEVRYSNVPHERNDDDSELASPAHNDLELGPVPPGPSAGRSAPSRASRRRIRSFWGEFSSSADACNKSSLLKCVWFALVLVLMLVMVAKLSSSSIANGGDLMVQNVRSRLKQKKV
jgi:hypothetical protein